MGLCASSLSDGEKAEALSQTPIFLAGTAGDLARFSRFFAVRQAVPGEVVLRENERGGAFYVIGAGEVEVTASDAALSPVSLCHKRAGDFFGDGALFEENHVHALSVTAVTPCTLLRLPRPAFERYLKSHEREFGPGSGAEMRDRLAGIMGAGMVSHLGAIRWLRGLDDWKLHLLASLFQYETVAAGDAVFRQGDAGRQLYVVLHGAVSVLAATESGEERELAVLKEGAYFGEIALMIEMPRTATVAAAEDCLLISLAQDDFERFLRVVPDLRARFELASKRRVAEQFKAFDVPFFSSIPDRLYSELAELCEYCEYQPHATIFSEGDPGRTFYIIVYGAVSVLVNRDGVPVKVDAKGPGRYFGEIALLKNVERTATVITDSRCVLLTITQERFSTFFVNHPEAFADFEIKLARRDVSLEAVLRHPEALRYFRRHLESEYATENLEFWLAARDYAAMPHGTDAEREAMAAEAARLAGTFVAEDGERQVNLPAKLRRVVLQAVEARATTPDTLRRAAAEAYAVMERDSFKRFTAGAVFGEFLERIDAYRDDRVRARVLNTRDRDLTLTGSDITASASAQSIEPAAAVHEHSVQLLPPAEEASDLRGGDYGAASVYGDDEGVEEDLFGPDTKEESII